MIEDDVCMWRLTSVVLSLQKNTCQQYKKEKLNLNFYKKFDVALTAWSCKKKIILKDIYLFQSFYFTPNVIAKGLRQFDVEMCLLIGLQSINDQV